jgi:organic radical activating enzyme
MAKPRNLKEIKIKLDQKGPGFCMAKWYHVSMHLHKGMNHSCYHPAPHIVPLEEIHNNPSALHNSEHKKQQRKIMLEGGRPSECSYCWDIEDLPGEHLSDRPHRSSESWAIPLIEQTQNIDWRTDVNPRYLEVNFGYECQLKCSYCTTTISSSWYQEIKKFGQYELYNPQNKAQYSIDDINRDFKFYPKEDENPYIEAFWKWFPEIYPTLHTFRLTGGEPLLSSNTFRVLDYIDQNPRNCLNFAINTNMCVPKRNIEKFVDYCKRLKSGDKLNELTVFTSVDTWGPQSEYIRNGFNMSKWLDNIDLYLDNVKNTNVSFMITFCFMSIPKFRLLLDQILEMRRKYSQHYPRIEFDTPYLIEPPHLSAQLATDEHIQWLNDTLTYMKPNVKDNWDPFYFTKTEYDKLERVVRWIEHNRYQDNMLRLNRNDFVRFVDQHDERRGTNFLETFPELEKDYWEWKNYA